MLILRFDPIGHEKVIDFLTEGHIVVKDGQAEHASASSAQPLFLLDSIHQLLSGVFNFLFSPTDKQYVFQSMYGDYGIKLTRSRKHVLSVYAWGHQNHLISQTTPEQFRLALWQGVEQLFSKYALPDELKEDDIASSVDSCQELDALLQQWVATFPELPPIVIL